MRHAFRTLALTSALLCGCPAAESDDSALFIGSYKTTITLSGTGSQTFTDSMSINDGSTSDLVLQSQQLGAVQATITSRTTFVIDQQQITLTNSDGQAFAVTIDGSGTVNGGVLNANGTLSSSSGALSYTIAGARL
ncbi:MAG TPA: hypothetical protein VFQ53_13455 [Kofleriaceae bacterium]|nr:hypothetical protein [Kofleriaceae bacterium]